MIKIKILNTEHEKFSNENSGLSILVENNEETILFDTSLGNEIIDKIKDKHINFLVLSHGHIDHTDGLRFINLKKVKKLVTHPSCFKPRFYKKTPIGIPVSLDFCKQKTEVKLTTKPLKLTKNVIFLGEIPRINFFEKIKPVTIESEIPDFVEDDSAIAIKTSKGTIIITGCSHSGICNIINFAKEVTKQRVIGVIGGFHLFNFKQAKQTIEFLKNEKIELVRPMHCLSKEAFKLFEQEGFKKIKTNEELIFEE